MCVTVAIKLPRDKETGEPTKDAKWCLFKIRDRAYTPTYTFKSYDNGDSTSLFLVDEDTDWSECIRVNDKQPFTELMFVNSALNNSVDLKDGKSKGKKKTSGKKADHGLVARRVARTHDLKGAVKAFKEMKFDGCTFISDGNKCYLIECSLPAEAKKKLRKQENSTFRAVADIEDFITTVEEIKDWLAVRTNHGITNETAGYQRKDGLSYESSQNRRDYAEKYIRENVFDVDDIIPAIDALGKPEIDKNPFLRPRRVREEIEELAKKDDDVVCIFSTSAFIMTSDARVIIKLYDAAISKMNASRIYSQEYPIRVTVAS